MAKNVYTYYQTNEYMGMGFGYRTYSNLSDAMDSVGKTGVFCQRITEVYSVTCVNSKISCRGIRLSKIIEMLAGKFA